MTDGDGAATDGPRPPRPSVARASAIMAAGTGTSRVLGFVRLALLAAVLGATAENLAANAFAVANTIPNALYLLIAGGALNAVLVPQIVRADGEGEAGRARLDRLFTISVTGMAALTVVLTLSAGLLIELYTEDLGPAQVGLAAAFAVWTIPQVFFYGLYALFGQVLNARGSFGPYMWAPAANNVVVVLGLIGVLAVSGPLADRPPEAFGPLLVAALAGTATLGVVVQALVLVPFLRATGFRLRPRWGWRGAGLRSAGRVAAWTFAGLVLSQVAYLVLNRVATAAEEAARLDGTADRAASVAAWGFAFVIVMLPHSLIAVSVVTAQFTGFAHAAGERDLDRLRRDAMAAVRLLLVGMALPAVALVVLAQPVAMLLFGGDAGRGLAVGLVLAALALGLPAFSATYQMQRVFYALTEGRTPFLISGGTSVAWILALVVVAQTAPPRFVVPWAALTLAGTQILSAVLLVVVLHRRLGGFGARGTAWVAIRALLAAAAAGTVTAAVLLVTGTDAAAGNWPLPTAADRWSALVPVVAGGLLCVAGYAGAAWALDLREATRFVVLARRLLDRVRPDRGPRQ
ncbi:MAG: murein biosynthesis integral membrane protein MurJ [Kineosporiaceae bacterium]